MTRNLSAVIATRESPLAMAQARFFARLAEERAGILCTLKTIRARGDEISGSLADIGGKELFIGNLRRALLDGEADIAVHSLKDIPAEKAEDFADIAIGFAEDPRDVFVAPRPTKLTENSLCIGTCSPRRAALLREYYPSVRVAEMRGNVQTRLKKMHNGECDGIILAAAGMRRLNLIGNAGGAADDLYVEFLPPDIFIPAPGQGMLAAECAAVRADEKIMRRLRDALRDPAAALRRVAETEFARRIGGDCHTPLGAFADKDECGQRLRAFYAGGGAFRKTVVAFSENNENGAHAAATIAAETLLQK